MTNTSPKDTVLEPGYIDLTADIVAAYVSNNPVASSDLPGLIASVHSALSATVQASQEPVVQELVPAVPVKKSVSDDYIICLEDGKKFKSLKRHLRSHYGLTPEEYRAKWDLAPDYPMVAPNYAAARSELAKKMGLGLQRAKKGRK
ncbi:MucR family transcriptional regulator (plasmid) [Roseibium aggregatum]|uniref:MucR family transcriptional regulator n=1 Tax=Roseibium aggregatum TaxID=187304 RepID=UPI001E447EAB|nr:MucR family transcriptional regulator [Roseibium aggregatum]UES60067.1 MucR family transcriptional regulator [Roseibium aggregatum]